MSSLAPTTRRPARRRAGTSLRFQLAIVIAALSLFPSLVLAVNLLTDASLLPALLVRLSLIAALSAAIGFIVSRVLLSPLTRLADQVSLLARSGQRLNDIRLEGAGALPAEVDTLRSAFSGLLDALRDEQGKRSAFMATLVHDLKTPIIAGNHVLEAIRENAQLGREERIELISSLRRENEALLDLVQKMVDAHRFELEAVQLELRPVDLGALARAVAARFEGARARGVRVEASGEGWALAAPAELERAVTNLAGNAVRYARSAVRLEADGAALEVRDDGPGLPAPLEDLARPFHSATVELAGRRYTAGTGGLGLFIASRIVAAHGGRLEALPGPGARLRVTLRAPDGAAA